MPRLNSEFFFYTYRELVLLFGCCVVPSRDTPFIVLGLVFCFRFWEGRWGWGGYTIYMSTTSV